MKTVFLALVIALAPVYGKSPAPPDPKRGVARLGAALARGALERYPKQFFATSFVAVLIPTALFGVRSRAVHRAVEGREAQRFQEIRPK
jgi:hypothetical protein